jgi:hypothetical protein
MDGEQLGKLFGMVVIADAALFYLARRVIGGNKRGTGKNDK